MLSAFTLAFFLGMSHALEADHLAAVSTMVAKQTRVSTIIRTGAVWGLGHATSLFTFAGLVLILRLSIGIQLADWLEFSVGLMLIGLGGHILYRVGKDRIHFHLHKHAQGIAHIHAHSHAGEATTHAMAPHDHDHQAFPFKSLYVGMMHGMAGSAAVLVLAASRVQTPAMGLLYLGLFGIGSIMGMATLSAVIAIPLTLSAKMLTWANRGIHTMAGVASFAIGLHIIYISPVIISFSFL